MLQVIGFSRKKVWVKFSETSELRCVWYPSIKRQLDMGVLVEGVQKDGKWFLLKSINKLAAVKAKAILGDSKVRIKNGVLLYLTNWGYLADKNNIVKLSNYCGVVAPEITEVLQDSTLVTLVLDDDIFVDYSVFISMLRVCYVDVNNVSDINVMNLYWDCFTILSKPKWNVTYYIDREERKNLFKGLCWLCWGYVEGEDYAISYLGSSEFVIKLMYDAIPSLHLLTEFKDDTWKNHLLVFEYCDFINEIVLSYIGYADFIERIFRYLQCKNYSQDVLIKYRCKILSLINQN